jgi:hypothetical protein
VSAALAPAPPSLAEQPARSTGVTLEERLGRALDRAFTDEITECPVCSGRLASTPSGASCQDCASAIQ